MKLKKTTLAGGAETSNQGVNFKEDKGAKQVGRGHIRQTPEINEDQERHQNYIVKIFFALILITAMNLCCSIWTVSKVSNTRDRISEKVAEYETQVRETEAMLTARVEQAILELTENIEKDNSRQDQPMKFIAADGYGDLNKIEISPLRYSKGLVGQTGENK